MKITHLPDGWHQPCNQWNYWQDGIQVARIYQNLGGYYNWELRHVKRSGQMLDTLEAAQKQVEAAWKDVAIPHEHDWEAIGDSSLSASEQMWRCTVCGVEDNA